MNNFKGENSFSIEISSLKNFKPLISHHFFFGPTMKPSEANINLKLKHEKPLKSSGIHLYSLNSTTDPWKGSKEVSWTAFKNDIKRIKRGSLSLLPIKSHYDSLQEYQSTYRTLLMQEYLLEKKELRNDTINDVLLEFYEINSKMENGGLYRKWKVQFPVPQQFEVDSGNESNNSSSHFLRVGDGIKFKWDPSYNPSEISDEKFSHMEGKIK